MGRESVSWQQFSDALLERFGQVETELVFDMFKKLQQVNTVEHYYDEFEKCRGQLLQKIPSLTEEYFLENFIGGLQGEIKGMIRLLEPHSLEQALKLAKFYEQTLSSQSKKSYTGTTYKTSSNTSTPAKNFSPSAAAVQNSKGSLLTSTTNAEVINSKPKPLTYSQREERRQKGLCFYCDERFTKGHECKKPQSFSMVADLGESEEYSTPAKYDEEPGEDLENWKDQDLILTALGQDKLKRPQPIQFDGNSKTKVLEF